MRGLGKMMRQALQSIWRKPATVLYPAVKVTMPPKFRGKLVFYPEKCICCKLCMRDCPTGAITIRKVGEKQFEADIDLGKCIYCAQCVDVCPKNALEATGDFELAQLEHGKLRITYRAEPENKPEESSQPEPRPEGEPAAKP
jgi:formate hydrogenlyase subunit 6/NADH:ubiquinone oxidoreductase subunit I